MRSLERGGSFVKAPLLPTASNRDVSGEYQGGKERPLSPRPEDRKVKRSSTTAERREIAGVLEADGTPTSTEHKSDGATPNATQLFGGSGLQSLVNYLNLVKHFTLTLFLIN